MPTETGKKTETLVGDLVDRVFPFGKLLKWARIAAKTRRETGKRGGNPEIFPNLRRITMHPDFLTRNRFGIDVSVVRPSSGLPVEILYGSYFHPESFEVLESPGLSKALEQTRRSVKPVIDRSQFHDALDTAEIMVASIIIPHGLSQQELQEIVQTHILPINLWDPVVREWRKPAEAALLIYGGMKVVANRLDYSSVSQPG